MSTIERDRPRGRGARHRHASILLHATSTYPMPAEEANLRMIADPARAVPACRSATRATSAACRSRSPRWRSAPSPSSATSRSTARCGAPTRRRRSSRSGLEHLVRDIRIIDDGHGRRRQAGLPGRGGAAGQAAPGRLRERHAPRRRRHRLVREVGRGARVAAARGCLAGARRRARDAGAAERPSAAGRAGGFAVRPGDVDVVELDALGELVGAPAARGRAARAPGAARARASSR